MNPIRAAAFQRTDWASYPVECLAEGIERQMIYGERLMVCRFSFAPCIVPPVHSHQHEQIALVERGRVRFRVGTDDRFASPGDVLFFPSGLEHGATMLDEPVAPVDVFSPPREEFLPHPARP